MAFPPEQCGNDNLRVLTRIILAAAAAAIAAAVAATLCCAAVLAPLAMYYTSDTNAVAFLKC